MTAAELSNGSNLAGGALLKRYIHKKEKWLEKSRISPNKLKMYRNGFQVNVVLSFV